MGNAVGERVGFAIGNGVGKEVGGGAQQIYSYLPSADEE